jgi:hypothetical protein
LDIISRLSHLAGARGSVSEVGGVQGGLLFWSQDRDVSETSAVTTLRADRILSEPTKVFSTDRQERTLFAALSMPREVLFRSRGT